MTEASHPDVGYRWRTHYDAEHEVGTLLDRALERSTGLRRFATRLAGQTSTRLPDWVDHIEAPVEVRRLADAGFRETPGGLWRHSGAQLPAVAPADRWVVAVRVDDAAAFGRANGGGPVEGAPLSALRIARVRLDGGVTLAGVERRSWAATSQPTKGDDRAAGEVLAAWRGRNRSAGTNKGMRAAVMLARESATRVGPDLAAALMMQVEREFWQARNTVARVQFARQQRLGLGWGNHDHHTFRSSRAHFAALLEVLHCLGFVDRERFHAGAEAGWGAQVLEHPGAGLVVFADVDLDATELEVDFAAGLPPREVLGTVGLWCALHGESLLGAGMHHLEGQFDFDRLRTDLAGRGIAMLPAFSDFTYLRQAFTQAERWPVEPQRLDRLVQDGHLPADKAAQFRAHGAPGSHLENLARRGGFKGFNQTAVSDIIRRTDVRLYDPAG